MCDGLVSKKALILSLDTIPTRNFAGNRLPSSHRQDALDRRRIGRMFGGEPRPDRASGQWKRSGCDRKGVRRVECSGEGVEQRVVVGHEIGLTRDDLDQVATGDFDEEWEYFVTNPIAKESDVDVRRILEGRPTEFGTHCTRLVTPNVEERVKNATRRSAGHVHADESTRTRSAQQVDDDGFDSIVGGVAGEDVVGKNRVASCPSPSLEVGTGLDCYSTCLERRADLASALGHEIGFVCRTGTKAMIDVNGGDRESVVNGQCHEGE